MSDKTPPPSINVTPLIDVLLVLLIIFMVLAPRREQKLPVQAPAADTGAPASPETLMLTVADDMQLALNTTPVTLEDLPALLSDLMEQRPVESRMLLIKAPPNIPYDPIVSLIDRAKGAGVVTVGLISGS